MSPCDDVLLFLISLLDQPPFIIKLCPLSILFCIFIVFFLCISRMCYFEIGGGYVSSPPILIINDVVQYLLGWLNQLTSTYLLYVSWSMKFWLVILNLFLFPVLCLSIFYNVVLWPWWRPRAETRWSIVKVVHLKCCWSPCLACSVGFGPVGVKVWQLVEDAILWCQAVFYVQRILKDSH